MGHTSVLQRWQVCKGGGARGGFLPAWLHFGRDSHPVQDMHVRALHATAASRSVTALTIPTHPT